MRVLKGDMYAGKADRRTDRTKRDIIENFKAYGLTQPELIRMDNHLLDRHCKFSTTKDSAMEGIFDVIVTDPPYGIRAGAKKSGRKSNLDYRITEEKRDDHIPATQHYPVEEVMLDLLHTAARILRMDGRLVYLIPTTYDFTMEDLPVHPCLKIVTVCHQELSSRHGRRAVVMQKVKCYDLQEEQNFQDYKRSVLAGNATGFGQLIGKLERALAGDAHDNSEVAKQYSKQFTKRREKKAKNHKAIQDGSVQLVQKQENDL